MKMALDNSGRPASPKHDEEAVIEQPQDQVVHRDEEPSRQTQSRRWRGLLGRPKKGQKEQAESRLQARDTSDNVKETKPPKWSMGVLNDRETDEVPG
jgi:hypothetical protein